MAGRAELLGTLQNTVVAIQAVATKLSNTFLQQGTVISSGITTANSTITFSSSQAAGFIAVITSSGAAGYIPWYR